MALTPSLTSEVEPPDEVWQEHEAFSVPLVIHPVQQHLVPFAEIVVDVVIVINDPFLDVL